MSQFTVISNRGAMENELYDILHDFLEGFDQHGGGSPWGKPNKKRLMVGEYMDRLIAAGCRPVKADAAINKEVAP